VIRDSVLVIATHYGPDGLGIESWWGARFSPPVQTGPGAHLAPCTVHYVPDLFLRGKAAGTCCYLEYTYTYNLPLGLHTLFYGELINKRHENNFRILDFPWQIETKAIKKFPAFKGPLVHNRAQTFVWEAYPRSGVFTVQLQVLFLQCP